MSSKELASLAFFFAPAPKTFLIMPLISFWAPIPSVPYILVLSCSLF